MKGMLKPQPRGGTHYFWEYSISQNWSRGLTLTKGDGGCGLDWNPFPIIILNHEKSQWIIWPWGFFVHGLLCGFFYCIICFGGSPGKTGLEWWLFRMTLTGGNALVHCACGWGAGGQSGKAHAVLPGGADNAERFGVTTFKCRAGQTTSSKLRLDTSRWAGF